MNNRLIEPDHTRRALLALLASVSPLSWAGASDCPVNNDSATAGLAAVLCNVVRPGTAADDLLHAVVVERQGAVVAESYFTAKDRIVGEFWSHETAFGPNELHDVRSVSKGVVALLVGIALVQGRIPSLDTPALDLLPDRAPYLSPDKRRVTVRHLLTMTAGFDWGEDGAVSLLSDETRMEFSSDMVGYALGRAMVGEPGQRYVYNSGCVVVLGAILEQVTGMPLEKFARKALFEPMGITELEWRKNRSAQVMAHAGLRLRPRDLAKVGRMVVDGGVWQGRRVVGADYMRQCMQGYVRAENDWQYGFHWRSGDLVLARQKWHWAAAMGNGGQRLYVLPGMDLVVVIMAGRYNQSYPQNALASDQLFARIAATVEGALA